MIRKTALTASLIAGAALSFSAPANATFWHKHYCNCGHNSGSKQCGGNTSTSGGTTTTGGNTTSGNTTSGNTTSGNTTSGNTTTGGTTTSGGTKVPEPGMLGLMGAGLAGLAIARRKGLRRKS